MVIGVVVVVVAVAAIGHIHQIIRRFIHSIVLPHHRIIQIIIQVIMQLITQVIILGHHIILCRVHFQIRIITSPTMRA